MILIIRKKKHKWESLSPRCASCTRLEKENAAHKASGCVFLFLPFQQYLRTYIYHNINIWIKKID